MGSLGNRTVSRARGLGNFRAPRFEHLRALRMERDSKAGFQDGFSRGV
jgi:hypothetical protein